MGSAEDVVAFVVAGGYRAVAFELVDGARDGVALLVAVGVELRWPAALAAAAASVVLVAAGSGMVALIRCCRREERIVRLE